jgi:8-oxo-dGTP pyrophosphatase MutT (NUDIX family)
MSDDRQFWTVLNSHTLLQDRWIHVRAEACETARGVRVEPYYLLDNPAFVHVIALDDADNIVMVRQYRHGSRAMSLELPGGIIDSEDSSIEAAGGRELLEETGYELLNLELVASLSMDPARYTKPIHFLFGRGARRIGRPALDETEDIEVVTLPLRQAIALALDGGIIHAAHVAGLMIAAKKQGCFSGAG